MAIKFWSGVGVAIQSALAAAQTITGITQANPGVVSSAGTLPANGDFVLLTVQGMHQLDQRVVRVANVGAGTFELEGVDTSLFDAFSSGTFEVITFGTTLTKAAGVNASGGDFEFSDLTTIHDNIRKSAPTVASPMQYNFDCFWDPSDAALIALKAASDSKSTRAVRFTFADGSIFVFSGFIGASMAPTGTAQDTVKTAVNITANGRPTTYAS